MDFFKKHWFQFILLVLLLIFVISYSLPKLNDYYWNNKCRNTASLQNIIKSNNIVEANNCVLRFPSLYSAPILSSSLHFGIGEMTRDIEYN
jgi:hypothetical protein